jgi:molybdopterin molybdotransferase
MVVSTGDELIEPGHPIEEHPASATGAPRELPQTVALGRSVKFNKGVTYFLPVSVHYDERGCGVALPRPPNGPGDFLSLAGSHGFVELPPQAEDFPEGFLADFYRW